MSGMELGIYRMKSPSSATVVDMIRTNRQLKWMRTNAKTSEIYSVSQEAITTCYTWTAQGYIWTFRSREGKPPTMNMDQVDDLRARIGHGEFRDLDALMAYVMHVFWTSRDAEVQSRLASIGNGPAYRGRGSG